MEKNKKPKKLHSQTSKSNALVVKDYKDLGKITAEDLEKIFNSSTIEAHLAMAAIDTTIYKC